MKYTSKFYYSSQLSGISSKSHEPLDGQSEGISGGRQLRHKNSRTFYARANLISYKSKYGTNHLSLREGQNNIYKWHSYYGKEDIIENRKRHVK